MSRSRLAGEFEVHDDRSMTIHGRRFPRFSWPEIPAKVVEILDAYPRGRVLDLPTGSGALAWWLHNRGFEVVGADIAPASFQNPEISVAQADLNGRLTFADDSFDYACFLEGPEHLENAFNAFREFARVLKPGGRLVTSIPNYLNLENRLKTLVYGTSEKLVAGAEYRRLSEAGRYMLHINRMRYPELRMAIEYAGFRIERLEKEKTKRGQRILWPLAALIRILSRLRGAEGRRKYWVQESNSPVVLMGGNTLIAVCVVEK